MSKDRSTIPNRGQQQTRVPRRQDSAPTTYYLSYGSDVGVHSMPTAERGGTPQAPKLASTLARSYSSAVSNMNVTPAPPPAESHGSIVYTKSTRQYRDATQTHTAHATSRHGNSRRSACPTPARPQPSHPVPARQKPAQESLHSSRFIRLRLSRHLPFSFLLLFRCFFSSLPLFVADSPASPTPSDFFDLRRLLLAAAAVVVSPTPLLLTPVSRTPPSSEESFLGLLPVTALASLVVAEAVSSIDRVRGR